MSRPAAGRGRRARNLAALAALLFALTGCAQLTDIHQRSLVFGLGLDEGPKPGMITLTSQAMHPTEGGGSGAGGTGGGAGGGAGSAEWKTIVATGPTFGEALARMQAETDREIFLGQLAVVILGTTLARPGTLHDMDALMRSPQVPENVPVAVVDGKAATFLERGNKKQVSWKLFRFLTRPRAGMAVLTNPFWHFMSQSLDLTAATYAPAFVADPKTEGFRFVGTAVFVDGRMLDTLSLPQTDALGWIISHGGFGGVSTGSGRDELHVAIQGVHSAWDLSDPSLAVLRLSATGQLTTSPGESLAEGASKVKQIMEREMTLQIEGVLDRLRADGADLLGIGERLREQGDLPPGPWSAHFKRLRFAVTVSLHLVPGKVR